MQGTVHLLVHGLGKGQPRRYDGDTSWGLIWDGYGPSPMRGEFFDFEVGGHDGACKGRMHVIVPFAERKNGNLSNRQQSYNDVHGWYSARIEQLFCHLWHWALVRKVWRGSADQLHHSVRVFLHFAQFAPRGKYGISLMVHGTMCRHMFGRLLMTQALPHEIIVMKVMKTFVLCVVTNVPPHCPASPPAKRVNITRRFVGQGGHNLAFFGGVHTKRARGLVGRMSASIAS